MSRFTPMNIQRTFAILFALLTYCPLSLVLAGGFTRDGATGELKRAEWKDSKVIGSPEPPLPYRPVRRYESLKVFQPVYVRPEPGRERLFVVDHKGDWSGPGGIRVYADRQDVVEGEPLLHMDRLIYGFCFHPQYLTNGYIFVISNGPVK